MWKIYLNGIFEKSILLSNQQETLLSSNKGSSETEAQGIPLEILINSAKPIHIKEYNKNFIDWFVGFTEGDGSFIIDYKTNRPSFIITQKDPKVLYYIRKNIGFGKVYLCNDKYYRYIVSKKTNLLYLINLFSGKLLLFKTNQRYINWIYSFNLHYKLNDIIEICYIIKVLDNTNAWLSGFIDAEGCFDAVQRSKRLTFRMRFSIKQKGEFIVFNNLPYIWKKKEKCGYLTKKKDIIIYTMDSIKSLQFLLQYLKIFKLHSNKNISFIKWLKLYRVIEDGNRGKSYETIKDMAQNINKFGVEDSVHDLEKD